RKTAGPGTITCNDGASVRVARSLVAEARLQATEHFRFEAAHMIPRFFAKPTMKLLRQSNADHPTPGMLHQGKASDNGSGHEAENQSDEGGNCGAHGDTPPIRDSTIMVMATERTAATNNSQMQKKPHLGGALVCHAKAGTEHTPPSILLDQ